MTQKHMTSRCAWSLWIMSAVLIRRLDSSLVYLALMASMISSDPMQPRAAGAQESEPPKSVLLPATPKTWSLAHSFHPGGPEGRRMTVTEVALNQDGEFNKVTFRARKPEEATKSASQLSVEERGEYLRQFAAALESFSFEPAMVGWADTPTVMLSLKSGRRSMEIVINEIHGETNFEFRSRLAKFLPVEKRIDTIKKLVQPDPAKRFARVADAWGMYVTLELGTTRLYKVDVEGSAWRTKVSARDPTITRITAIASPGQLRMQEFEPGIIKPLTKYSADLNKEIEQTFLELGLTTLRDFVFPAEDEAAEGNIAVSLTLRCHTGGEAARKLTIKQTGMTAAQFDKSVAAELIRLVNERVPEENRMHWE